MRSSETSPRHIATQAITGAAAAVRRARDKLNAAGEQQGWEAQVGFPSTTYYLPVAYSLLGTRVRTLQEADQVLRRAEQLLPSPPQPKVWLPYLGSTLDAGIATLLAYEIEEACKYLIGPHPVDGIWLGAAEDVIIRQRGIEFVDGTAPGFAAVVGAAPDAATAVRIARSLQEKNLYVFMAGHVDGVSFAEQLASEGVQLGWDTRLIPFGKETSAAIYALGFANRVALSFGGVEAGNATRNLLYNKERTFAFVMALGHVNQDKYAAAAGAINYGFPTIADTDIPEILPTGVCTYEHVVANVPHDQIVERCLEVRGCKVQISKVPVPVHYGPAFEGERIRKGEFHVEFGGKRATGFEFLSMRDLSEVADGRIEVNGPRISEVPAGASLPICMWVEVAGRKMQRDFEPILERQIHHQLNGASGLWHMGQRGLIWMRISKEAYKQGFELRHIGEIIRSRLLADFPAIVDKVQVTIHTQEQQLPELLQQARTVWVERNQRLADMTDESVEVFYSCLLCQSFAPNHVCIITPERLGLCGAYNWLDGKAAYEIDSTGPNQPVRKGECLDPVRGQWQDVNEYVYLRSNRTLERFCAYSIMVDPMTSCGCFECIVALVPECNGVMIVDREFDGMTPCGMTFTTLAGMIGGGVQTPGFIGIGKSYVASAKFIRAEGGISRLVWMPSRLREELRPQLVERLKAESQPQLLDLIADETVTADPMELLAHCERVGHPALGMDPLM